MVYTLHHLIHSNYTAIMSCESQNIAIIPRIVVFRAMQDVYHQHYGLHIMPLWSPTCPPTIPETDDSSYQKVEVQWIPKSWNMDVG